MTRPKKPSEVADRKSLAQPSPSVLQQDDQFKNPQSQRRGQNQTKHLPDKHQQHEEMQEDGAKRKRQNNQRKWGRQAHDKNKGSKTKTREANGEKVEKAGLSNNGGGETQQEAEQEKPYFDASVSEPGNICTVEDVREYDETMAKVKSGKVLHRYSL